MADPQTKEREEAELAEALVEDSDEGAPLYDVEEDYPR